MQSTTENPTQAGQPSGLSVIAGSAPSLRDILPPGEIIEAAEKVRVWMETNGYRHRWILGGVCSRDHSERLQWWIKNAEDIAKERGELFRAGENMAAELCQWCPHEMRGEVLRAWDAAAEPIRQMKRDLSPQNAELCRTQGGVDSKRSTRLPATARNDQALAQPGRNQTPTS